MSHSGESNAYLRPEGELEDEQRSQDGTLGVGSEDQVNGEHGNLEEDLFGDGDDGDQEEEEGEHANMEEDVDESELKKRQEMEYEEEQTQHLHTTTRETLIAEATLQNLPLPYASDGKYWDLRMPNFLSLESQAFSDQKFLDEPDETNENEEEKASTGILPDSNTIRWRWVRGPDGKAVKQSNTRVVVWSDGSRSLQVGSEFFDMVFIPDNQQTNTLSHLSKTASQQPQSTSDPFSATQGLTYLFVRQGDSQVLEAQTSITGQISLRPYSLNSLTHRSLVANRTMNKTYAQRQTRLTTVTVDPEKQKIEKELEEARKLKEEKKKESQRARTSDRQNNQDGTGPRGSRKRKFNARLLSEEDEEEEEEEGEEEEVDNDDDEDPDMDDGYGEETSRTADKLSEIELADQRLEQSRHKNYAEKGDGGREDQGAGALDAQKPIKKRLIIASDEDE
ncbi:hypothetical protein CROQUDRAFT_510987 [Cronartium quercuum f. sp. fusiforme G11]|uniref:RNA polymerase-associated protein LEO1 n=1 Tax=Cronartium quercuum f. sp. fusiforme G11 TaxID=708437 RepID=A0A9P6TBW9_9BASI|nr:hypothetical protein CROQUDRAFT_510987 [Cronartium quercuum f. sp. fusiforme G11]